MACPRESLSPAESRDGKLRLVRPGAAVGKDTAGVILRYRDGECACGRDTQMRVVPRKGFLSSCCGMEGFFIALRTEQIDYA